MCKVFGAKREFWADREILVSERFPSYIGILMFLVQLTVSRVYQTIFDSGPSPVVARCVVLACLRA